MMLSTLQLGNCGIPVHEAHAGLLGRRHAGYVNPLQLSQTRLFSADFGTVS